MEMNKKMLSRRDFLRFVGMSSAAFLVRKPMRAFAAPMAMDMPVEPFMPDAEISITAAEKYVQILSGAQTRVWSYEGQLLSGSGVTVQAVPGSYLGPILRAQSGKKVRIYFHNNLAEDSVIHPHGLHVPEDCDG
jgi:FtsP/CotA-like multicopper oxidase with cupredoxin domain